MDGRFGDNHQGPFPEWPRQTVDALGIETNYYQAGPPDAPPIVLLHGMSTSADSFRELMHDLAGGFRLIAPDLPGFGHSQNTRPYTMPHLVEWLAAFYDALALPPAMLLGHSFGGIVASAFTLEYPEAASRLALLAPAVLVAGNYPEWLRKMGRTLGLVEVGVAVSRVFLERQIRVPFYDPARQHDSVWERRLGDRSRSRASAAAMNAAAAFDIRPRLAHIGQPALVIWGRNDPVLPPADAHTVARLIPAARLVILDECGHAPMLEQRAQVVRLLRAFAGPRSIGE